MESIKGQVIAFTVAPIARSYSVLGCFFSSYRMPRPRREKWPRADDYEERRLETLPAKKRRMSLHPMQEVPGLMVNFHVTETNQSEFGADERVRPVSIAYRKTGIRDSAEFYCYRRSVANSHGGMKASTPAIDFPREVWLRPEQLDLPYMNESVRSIRTSIDQLITARQLCQYISLPGEMQVVLHPRMLPANKNDKEDALEPKDPSVVVDPSKPNNLYDISQDSSTSIQ